MKSTLGYSAMEHGERERQGRLHNVCCKNVMQQMKFSLTRLSLPLSFIAGQPRGLSSPPCFFTFCWSFPTLLFIFTENLLSLVEMNPYIYMNAYISFIIVDLEIFIVKIFLWFVQTTKMKNTKYILQRIVTSLKNGYSQHIFTCAQNEVQLVVLSSIRWLYCDTCSRGTVLTTSWVSDI